MRSLAIAIFVTLLFTLSAGAQQVPEKLGTLNFPTSCSQAAQKEFTRAVALLHSFWFSEAIARFEAIVWFARGVGAARGGNVERAKRDSLASKRCATA